MSTKLAWGARVSALFRERAIRIAVRVACDASHLMSCMAFETGRTFSPSAKNPGSSATGLIQFMRDTAIGMNTTVEALARMTAEEQLDYVGRYLQPFAGRLKTLSDVYMAILWPAAVGKPEDAVIFPPGSKAFLANRGLDINHDGAVTKAEASQFVEKMLLEGMQASNMFDMATPTEAPTPAVQPEENKMGTLELVGIFGTVLKQLLPQIGTLFGGKKDAANIEALSTVFDTIVKNTGQTGTPDVANVGTAIQMMTTDKDVKQKVTEAIVTHPDILPFMEVGGGVVKAREYDVVQQQQNEPFWKTSAVFWISMMMLPLVFWYAGASIVGGIAVPPEWPWYAQLPLKIFGTQWSLDARAGLANLIVGLILGGICGVYYGISVTQARQQAQQTALEKTNG